MHSSKIFLILAVCLFSPQSFPSSPELIERNRQVVGAIKGAFDSGTFVLEVPVSYYMELFQSNSGYGTTTTTTTTTISPNGNRAPVSVGSPNSYFSSTANYSTQTLSDGRFQFSFEECAQVDTTQLDGIFSTSSSIPKALDGSCMTTVTRATIESYDPFTEELTMRLRLELATAQGSKFQGSWAVFNIPLPPPPAPAPCNAAATVADDAYCGAPPTPFSFPGGDGSSIAPFEIANKCQLHCVRFWPDSYFNLTADIDMNNFAMPPIEKYGTLGAGWMSNAPITGVTFDGLGHTISNYSYTGARDEYVGLFKRLEQVTIRDLNLAGLDLTADITTGGNIEAAGGLAGLSMGSRLENITLTGDVRTYTVGGGLAGQLMSGLVDNLDTSVNVTGLYDASISSVELGGIVGDSLGSVIVRDSQTDSIVNGYNVVGGGFMSIGGAFAEAQDTDFIDVTIRGNIIGPSNCTYAPIRDVEIGGVLGRAEGTINILRSTYTGDISGFGKYVGGIIGRDIASVYLDDVMSVGSLFGLSTVGGIYGQDPQGTLGAFTQNNDVFSIYGFDDPIAYTGTVSYPTNLCPPLTCGNGMVEAPETCDDGNFLSGDGCDSQCRIEAPPTVTLTVAGSGGPLTVAAGSWNQITWISTNATSCTVTPNGWSGTSGSQWVTINADTTFTASCTGTGGNASDSVVVTTLVTPPPTVNILANASNGPVSVSAGDSVTFNWITTDATSCSVSPFGWTGTNSTQSQTINSDTTVTLNCNGPGGSASDTVDVTVVPNPPPTVSLLVDGSTGPVSVASGSVANFQWTSANATSCNVTPYGWNGTNGNQNRTMNVTTTVTVNCNGPGGSNSASVVVNVIPNPPPTVDILADGNNGPISVSSGSSVNFTWTTSNASSCLVSPYGWTGLYGNQNRIMTITTTVTLNCNGPGGTTADSVVVNVIPNPPPTVSLSTPGAVSVPPGTSVTINWTSTDATSCTVSPYGWTGTSGNRNQTINVTTTFTANCTGPGGSASDTLTITVMAIPAPTVDMKVDGSDGPVTGTVGVPVNITWTSTNATSCNAWPGPWTGTSGNQNLTYSGPSATPMTFGATCTGPGGTVSDTVQVSIVAAAPPPCPDPINVVGFPNPADPTRSATLQWDPSGNVAPDNEVLWHIQVSASSTAPASCPGFASTGAVGYSGAGTHSYSQGSGVQKDYMSFRICGRKSDGTVCSGVPVVVDLPFP